MSPKCPFRINAVPPLNAMTDLGANNCHNDGSTDDTAHLEAGVAAAIAAGKRLYLPAGTGYALASQFDLSSGLYMYGDGVTTILKPAASQGIRIDGKINITLRDFKIDGDYTNSDMGIVFGSGACSGMTMTGLYIQDMVECGIYSNCSIGGCTISGCTVSHCGDFGIHFQNEGALGANGLTISDTTCLGFEGLSNVPHGIYIKVANNITLTNCECGNITGAYSNDSAFELDDVSNSYIAHCDAHDADYGIQLSRYGTVPTAVGCNNILIHASGGDVDSCTYYERFVYKTNYDITWDEECYGTLGTGS